jgi:hypothetical protein
MKGEQLFFEDERVLPGLPLDLTIPLAAWASLTVRNRVACYLADILSAVSDLQGLLATDDAAHLRWIGPELEHTADEIDRLLKGLTC